MKNSAKTLLNLKGAGRPKLPVRIRQSRVWHVSRPDLTPQKPIHVTLKFNHVYLTTLRNKKIYQVIRKSLKVATKTGLRIIHYTVQRDHIHLLIEATDKKQLGSSMRMLSISLTKRLSTLAKKPIKALSHRYHLHILNTLREIKNTISYLLNNGKKHGVNHHKIDFYSSFVALNSFGLSESFLSFLVELKEITSIPQFRATKKSLIHNL